MLSFYSRGISLNYSKILLPLTQGLKTIREKEIKIDFPKYDIEKTTFNLLTYFRDRNYTEKYHENTKVLSVEGLPCIGKEDLVQKLSKIFNMKPIDDISDDLIWVDDTYKPPIDYRDYNSMLSDGAQYYTIEKFFNDPNPMKKGRPLGLQQYILLWRYWNHCKAMAHLFHTGQGVVFNRTVQSDYVFAMAMRDAGLMSAEAYEIYYNIRRNLVPDLLKPHVVIYLKTSTNFALDKIKTKQLQSTNLNEKFLKAYQNALENDYLPKMNKYCEVFTVDVDNIDVNDEHDVDYLADQLTKINLEWDQYTSYDKFLQWKVAEQDNAALDKTRLDYSSVVNAFNVKMRFLTTLPHPESSRNLDENEEIAYIHSKDPRRQYDPRFDPKNHDLLSIMFKYVKNIGNYDDKRHILKYLN